jgi:hypothetical protein
MNPIREMRPSSRFRRGLLSFAAGLFISLGLVWASGLGTDDRNRSTRLSTLDMSAACERRDGPGSLAYFDGRTRPGGWRCAMEMNDDWLTTPITPAEGCTLLYGALSESRPASPNNPFTWTCTR